MTKLPTRHGESVPTTDTPQAAGVPQAGGTAEPAGTRPAGAPATASPGSPGLPQAGALPKRIPSAGLAPPTQRTHDGGNRAAPGTVIGGRYSLRTAIGHGGMGTVWRASDTLLRRDVAVKEVLLPPGVADSDREQMYQRTMREARAAAALSHPAVVQVYDVVTEAGRPWIVMELLQSRSLAEMIIEDGPLAARAVAKIGLALLGALEVAHAAGVLHRDVKPANVLICSDGRCVLTDFGVARMPTDSQLTTPGMVLGSPHFISPERAIGAKFGPPSDLFSLGVTLYTAVEGRPPFDKRDPFETMRAVVEEAPTPPVRAGSLTGVLYGLLEKDPDRRWNVPATRRVLRELLAGPLASSAAVHVTDPYAVVRPTPYAPPAVSDTPSTKIGGRAMLAPGESVSTAIRRRQAGEKKKPANAVSAASDVPTGAHAEDQGPHTAPLRHPHQAAAQGTQRAPATHVQLSPPAHAQAAPAHAQQAPQAAYPAAVAYSQPGSHTSHAASGPRTSHAVSHASHVPQPHNQRVGADYERAGHHHHAGSFAAGAGGLRDVRIRAMSAFRRLPRWASAAIAASVVLVVVLGIVAIAGLFGGDDKPGSDPQAQTTPSPSGPGFTVQEYRDDTRGIIVNVPGTWTKAPTKNYVDFVDPADDGRRLRINVEPAAGTPQDFLKVAERNLQNKSSTLCAAPYQRIGLRDVTINGRAAAELEYTCGQGDAMRHGVWAAFVLNSKAYEFFVTVQDRRFAESKAIYDEMVRSYKLAV